MNRILSESDVVLVAD